MRVKSPFSQSALFGFMWPPRRGRPTLTGPLRTEVSEPATPRLRRLRAGRIGVLAELQSADDLDEALDDAGRERRVLLDEIPQVPGPQHVSRQISLCRNGGDSGTRVESGDLAKMRPRPERGSLFTVRRHRCGARLDHEEAVPLLALFRDDRTGVERAL